MMKKEKYHRLLASGVTFALTTATLATGAGVITLGTALPAHACASEPYVGTICFTAANFCPYPDYTRADGTRLAIKDYTTLYALIGHVYHPTLNPDGANSRDDTQFFYLPDLQGRSPAGAGTGVGFSPVQLGAKLGAQQITLSATQVPIAPHGHTAVFMGKGAQTQSIEIPEKAGTLGVSATLNAKATAGEATVANGSYLGQGATSGAGQATIYVPSTSTVTSVALGGLDVKLTGKPGTPAIKFDIATGITDGTVTVQNSEDKRTLSPVATQSPILGLTACIATGGLYPTRP